MNYAEHIPKFVQELDRRGYSNSTVEIYKSNLGVFFSWCKRDHPKNCNEQDIKDYLYQFRESNTQRSHHSAIKKFYEICLRQPNKCKYIPYTKRSNRKPIILSQEEIASLVGVCKNIKHHAILCVLYATAIRINELLNIKISDIDRANMLIYIMHGKGNKMRSVPMKPVLLSILENYYRAYKPKEYLFQGQFGGKYSERSVNEFLKKYALLAGIKKRVYPHLIRHCSLTHSLEAGSNLYLLQIVAGHESPVTTAKTYLHLSPKIVANAYSPIESLTGLPQLQLPA